MDRGQKLADGKYRENSKLEEGINKMIDADEARYKRPVVAFVTFAQQEGLDRVDKYMSSKYNVFGKLVGNESGHALTFMNERLQVYRAPEPSNIVWENLHVTLSTTQKNQLLVQVVISVFLVLLFMGFLQINTYSKGYHRKYPHSLDHAILNR
jgi:hypothetical protein